MSPDVMIRQVEALAGDLRTLTVPFAEQVVSILGGVRAKAWKRVYLVGAGDSYFASCAAELAFRALASVPSQALSALRFGEYCAPCSSLGSEALVICVSSSGGTPAVVRAMETARRSGAFTIAITGNAASALSDAAHARLTVALGNAERSPGIRTFQASLLGLLLLAIHLGEKRGHHSAEAALGLQRELGAVSEVIASTTRSMKGPCQELALTLGDTPLLILLGAGPSYGTALFGAAKLVEAAGICALGQDIEEWWHVERFAYPRDMPLFVIAPPGRAHWRAAEIASAARQLGRRVVTVSAAGDTSLASHAWRALTVQGDVREEFSGLVYHLFAPYLAAYTAAYLGRGLFQSTPLQA